MTLNLVHDTKQSQRSFMSDGDEIKAKRSQIKRRSGKI